MTYQLGPDASAAASRLARQGLSLPPRPEIEIPNLPRDITELSDEQLMDLFVELTTWNDYISTQVAAAQVDERAAQRLLDVTEANATAANWSGGKDDRVAITKAKVATDSSVAASRDALAERHAYRKLVEALGFNVERDAALVSRELTRRTSGSTPTVRRSSRWST